MKDVTGQRILAAIAVLAAASLACATPGAAATTAPTEAPQETEAATATEAGLPPGFDVTTPESSNTGGRSISAGQKIATFGPYTVAVPDGWADNHQVAQGVVDTLLLTKGTATLQISQAPGGGGECHFNGEKGEGDVFPGAGVGITGGAAQFMRGTTDNGVNWTVCEKGPDTFGFPTDFGYITYKGTAAIDDATLKEMDGIVATLVLAK